MIPSQTEVKYRGSSKCFAAWWPLFEGPADLSIPLFSFAFSSWSVVEAVPQAQPKTTPNTKNVVELCFACAFGDGRFKWTLEKY